MTPKFNTTKSEKLFILGSSVNKVEEEDIDLDFHELSDLNKAHDRHFGYLMQIILLGCYKKSEIERYQRFLRAFYDVVFEESDFYFYVDATKYHSQLWHLIYHEALAKLQVTALRQAQCQRWLC